ncbi:MAG: type II secretion system F family protein, partial [Oscillospiraceae bacterium]
LQFSVFSLHLPVLGKIGLLKGASQFSNTLSTLLTAGLSLPRALHATGRVMDNYAMGQAVGKAIVGVEEGRSLGEVLKEDPYLPPLLKEMAAVGEEAGTLEDTLATIGAYYDSETETATGKALSMLEPAITIVMGVVIGFIVIALYIPMFTMYSGMGG